MSTTPCIRISPALAALGDRGFVHGRTQHRLQRTSATQHAPESRDITLARPQLRTSNVSASDYSSMNGLSSYQLQPQVEAPSILGEHNITLTPGLTRHEEGFLAFCEASALADGSNQRLPSLASAPKPLASVPKPLASLVPSLPSPPSALGGSIHLQEDGKPCKDCPGAPILDDPDPHYDYGTHPSDMVPLFPRCHPGATSLEGSNIATASWAVQTVNTGRRSVTPIVPPPSRSGASVPGQIRRRYSPPSGEMSSLLHEADSVPLFPSARPPAFRGASSLHRRDV